MCLFIKNELHTVYKEGALPPCQHASLQWCRFRALSFLSGLITLILYHIVMLTVMINASPLLVRPNPVLPIYEASKISTHFVDAMYETTASSQQCSDILQFKTPTANTKDILRWNAEAPPFITPLFVCGTLSPNATLSKVQNQAAPQAFALSPGFAAADGHSLMSGVSSCEPTQRMSSLKVHVKDLASNKHVTFESTPDPGQYFACVGVSVCEIIERLEQKGLSKDISQLSIFAEFTLQGIQKRSNVPLTVIFLASTLTDLRTQSSLTKPLPPYQAQLHGYLSVMVPFTLCGYSSPGKPSSSKTTQCVPYVNVLLPQAVTYHHYFLAVPKKNAHFTEGIRCRDRWSVPNSKSGDTLWTVVEVHLESAVRILTSSPDYLIDRITWKE